jgi:rod shape determining protein RodA
MLVNLIKRIDWILFSSAILLVLAGLFTMDSFSVNNHFFNRQVVWFVLSIIVFFTFSLIDWQFLKRTSVLMLLFIALILILLLLFIFGHISGGAQSWFNFGAFSFQPSDPAKLVLILLLAKYFSKRHVQIAEPKHIIISGVYALILFILVFLQPDFGSSVIIFLIWLGMVLVSGLSKKHLIAGFFIGIIASGFLWFFVFEDYQKTRVVSFMSPKTDIEGAGYNAYQSTLAVGSGQFWGKGLGYGSQSRLQFLPEHETDFIFAAFSEEWGFLGSLIVLALFLIIIIRIVSLSLRAETNFEGLFGLGLAIFFVAHVLIHVGMNIGLLPVTGTPLPFLSYGGSHLLTEFIGLGILSGMGRYNRDAHRDDMKNEFLGMT